MNGEVLKNYINGRWVESKSKDIRDIVNPVTGEVLVKVPMSTAKETQEAITAATAAFGSIIEVAGKGAGGWKVAQNAGQTIHFGDTDTTAGATGYLQNTEQYDAVKLLCTTANTDFIVLSSIGNITVA